MMEGHGCGASTRAATLNPRNNISNSFQAIGIASTFNGCFQSSPVSPSWRVGQLGQPDQMEYGRVNFCVQGGNAFSIGS